MVIVARELLVTALRSFLEEHDCDFSAKMSGKLKMVLQCVAAGACLVWLLPPEPVGLVGVGDFALVGGGADGVLRRGLRAGGAAAVAASGVGSWSSPTIVLVPILIPLAVLAVAAASAAIWIVVLARWWMRLPVIPYQPRRPAPWRGVHVLFALVVYLALAQVGVAAIHHAGFAEAAPTRGSASGGEHPIAKMLAGGRDNPWLLLTAFFTAVLAAPIVEEMFFRVLLQGWLEGAERRGRRFWPTCASCRCAAPIALSSILFGVVHYRGSETASPPTVIAIVSVVNAICELAAIAFILVFLPAVAAPRRPTSAGSRRNSPPTCVWDCWRPWRRCRRSTWRAAAEKRPARRRDARFPRPDPAGRGLGNALLPDASPRPVGCGACGVQRGRAAVVDRQRGVRQRLLSQRSMCDARQIEARHRPTRLRSGRPQRPFRAAGRRVYATRRRRARPTTVFLQSI